ncbi:MAG: hypothetical protein ATN35_07640 [Epulopiscium sp. Nele67-Bin004]|nr:MAG: hypothetical protein ATN35_07640 [Epulopiscium sp. Nele67-Bin004]
MRKIFTLILLASTALTACSSQEVPTYTTQTSTIKSETTNVQMSTLDTYYPVTITTYNYDMEPVEITFTEAPKNVVAVYQNSIETLLALGLEDTIVYASGLDHEVKDEYAQAFTKIPYSSDTYEPDAQTVIETNPDFILSWYVLFDDSYLGDVDYWHENGVNTYMLQNTCLTSNRTIENEIIDISNLGVIFDAKREAFLLLEEIYYVIERGAYYAQTMPPQSTIVIEITNDGIIAYGSETLAGDMILRLDAQLMHPQGGVLTYEQLVSYNPDSIFVVYRDSLDDAMAITAVEQIANNPILQNLTAVQNDKVFAMPLNNIHASEVRTINGLNIFLEGIYLN